MSGHIGNLSEEQSHILSLFRHKLFNEDITFLEISNYFYEDADSDTDLDPDSQTEKLRVKLYAEKFCDDKVLLRFLRAKKFDVNSAYVMLVCALRFRLSFQDIGVDAITAQSVANEINQGKTFFHNFDREGRPVCVVKVRNHNPSHSDCGENQRFSLFMMEYGRTLLKPPIETVTMIFDMTDAGMRNIDMRSLQFMIHSLQNYYPESLGKILIFNSPWFVYGIWKVVKPWLDVVTAAKVVFTDKKSIQDYISADCLLAEYGGRNYFKYDSQLFSTQASLQMMSVHPQQ